MLIQNDLLQLKSNDVKNDMNDIHNLIKWSRLMRPVAISAG